MLWLQHIKVSTKFYVIALVFSAPLVLLGYLFVEQSLKDIRFAERERAGTSYLSRAWPLFQAAIADRTPTAEESERLSSAADRHDGLMATAEARRRFLDAPAGQARIEAGQDFIQKIADGSWLTLDPDLDSYYVMDATTIKFPEVMVAVRALIDAADRRSPSRADAGGEGSGMSLAADRLLRSVRALRGSVQSAADGNPDGTVRAALATPLQGVLADVDRLARAVSSARPPAPAASVQAGRAAQVDLDALWQTSRDELDRLLRSRLDALKRGLEIDLSLAGALVLVVLVLMAAISHSIARRLNEIAATMDDMRAGHLERVVPNLGGRDEIGAIARTLEVFRERLISLRAFEGDLIAQEARTAAELSFRDILDVSPIGVVIVTRAGDPLYCNASFAEILGTDRAEVAHRNIGTIWPDRAKLMDRLQRNEKVRDLEVGLQRSDGQTATCLLSGEPIQYDGEAAALRWVYDITERKRSEAEMRQAQSRLVQTEKLASLGQLTAGIAHEIKNPLNFVTNFADLSTDLLTELRDKLIGLAMADEVRTDVEELTAMIGQNLDKVVQHGKRADSIIKNMLLHSREGSGERRSADFNATVREALNLAYHGARAEKPGFNVTLDTAFDAAVGEVDMYPQEFTRVLLNLISNGFYAVDKRRSSAGEPGFEPTVRVATCGHPDRVEVRVSDNGTGIPDEVKAKMFTPFFTTKPPGEGTGLGLSLSHDIVVKQHGGTIDLRSESGVGTEFTVTLPRLRAMELKRAS